MGQLARQRTKHSGGRFSANTETNPKDHYKALTTRSGRIIGKDVDDNLAIDEQVVRGKLSESKKNKSKSESEEETNRKKMYKQEKNKNGGEKENGECESRRTKNQVRR